MLQKYFISNEPSKIKCRAKSIPHKQSPANDTPPDVSSRLPRHPAFTSAGPTRALRRSKRMPPEIFRHHKTERHTFEPHNHHRAAPPFSLPRSTADHPAEPRIPRKPQALTIEKIPGKVKASRLAPAQVQDRSSASQPRSEVTGFSTNKSLRTNSLERACPAHLSEGPVGCYSPLRDSPGHAPKHSQLASGASPGTSV